MAGLIISGQEPIVGAPDVRSVAVMVTLKCQCGDPVTIVGSIGSQATCACKKVFTLNGIVINPNGTGGVKVAIDVPKIGG